MRLHIRKRLVLAVACACKSGYHRLLTFVRPASSAAGLIVSLLHGAHRGRSLFKAAPDQDTITSRGIDAHRVLLYVFRVLWLPYFVIVFVPILIVLLIRGTVRLAQMTLSPVNMRQEALVPSRV